MIIINNLQKYLFSSILILSITSPAFGCTDRVSNVLSSAIYQHWIHSYEEDVEEMQIYRPHDYQFPPSRGRDGFEIKENRQFIFYTIGATDRPQAIVGKWELLDETKLKVSLEGREDQSFTLEVVELRDQYLKVIKTFE